ncbi:MAG: sigma-54 dependent transcriptional regulator [Bdellovibrionota bacterium]
MTKKQIEIAVIDDDRDVQDLIAGFFRQKKYKVVPFYSAESALQASEAQGANWDVILTDLHLPKMSGLELTKALKRRLPTTPIILVTTTRNAETAVAAIREGAYDFIVKPIHFPQLFVSVERALHLKDLNSNLDLLRASAKAPLDKSGMIAGKSPKFVAALELARRVAKSKANILITGESGTGKEVFAKFIHHQGVSNKGPFIAINCSAIPEHLLESELFGHAKGAFTGAIDKKIGLFEEAEDGTLFLDEIGDLSLPLQAKLLRVLQEKQIKRVGENVTREINCRFVSATHKNLASEVANRNFREDLFFRLNVIPIQVPPLRERREDIVGLAEHFLRKYAAENGSRVRSFSKGALKLILENNWRGNVRELENSVERAVVLSSGPEIEAKDMKAMGGSTLSAADSYFEDGDDSVFSVRCEDAIVPLEEVVSRYIKFAVKKNRGAKDRTAEALRIDRKTLYKKMKSPEGEELSAAARTR